MTDLEITKLCAEAMGLCFRTSFAGEYQECPERELDTTGDGIWMYDEGSNMWNRLYYPLHDDAQAMALVKKWRLQIGTMEQGNSLWCVWVKWEKIQAVNDDLNRAICECVAKMQAAKKGEPSVQT